MYGKLLWHIGYRDQKASTCPIWDLNHFFSTMHLGAEHRMVWPVWMPAIKPWVFPKSSCIPVSTLNSEHCETRTPTGVLCLPGPLEQPIQGIGCVHYPRGCCLQPLHTKGPPGEEPGRLNWLQSKLFQQEGERGVLLRQSLLYDTGWPYNLQRSSSFSLPSAGVTGRYHHVSAVLGNEPWVLRTLPTGLHAWPKIVCVPK